MKQSVQMSGKVNGIIMPVTVTRAQVAAAQKELDQPQFQAGDIVVGIGYPVNGENQGCKISRSLIPSDEILRAMSKDDRFVATSLRDGNIVVISCIDGQHRTANPNNLLLVYRGGKHV